MSKLQGVADTLYIPLTARINISKKFPNFFYDEKALSLENEIPENNIEKKSIEYFHMASVCRYKVTDKIIKDFSDKHEVCNVINLGAGLETNYFRIKPEGAYFYEMDMPAVIDTRRRVLGESENEVLIAGDLFDLSWAEGIDKKLPTIMLASGVFQYFKEEKIKKFISEVKEEFENAEMVFDAMTSNALKYANKFVKKTGNTDAVMYFSVDDPINFAEENDIILVEQLPFFTEARTVLKNKLKLFTRIAMKVMDEGKRRGYVLHYRIR